MKTIQSEFVKYAFSSSTHGRKRSGAVLHRTVLASIDYSKYFNEMPEHEVYFLRVPTNLQPPKDNQVLPINGKSYIVFGSSTPEDIAKGRGGPVAKSMRENGIGWDVKLGLITDKLEQQANEIYDEFWPSPEGKKIYEEAKEKYPTDLGKVTKATDYILEALKDKINKIYDIYGDNYKSNQVLTALLQNKISEGLS
ncbi:MAG: hypothetical protein Q7R33_01720 [Nitrosarchaeum sp.]|nr:hypothetical protein [Nitrosarchaeum sp.]